MKNGRNWLLAAWVGLIFSIFAMTLTPVVTYTKAMTGTESFTILTLISDGGSFSRSVLNDYTGPVLVHFQGEAVASIAIIAVLAVLCAAAGLGMIGTQRPRRWQFRLTFIGLVGTAVPSLLILLGVFLSDRYFIGTLQCGAAPIITPIAMIVSIVAVAQRKNRLQAELESKLMTEGKIMRGGDLD